MVLYGVEPLFLLGGEAGSCCRLLGEPVLVALLHLCGVGFQGLPWVYGMLNERDHVGYSLSPTPVGSSGFQCLVGHPQSFAARTEGRVPYRCVEILYLPVAQAGAVGAAVEDLEGFYLVLVVLYELF